MFSSDSDSDEPSPCRTVAEAEGDEEAPREEDHEKPPSDDGHGLRVPTALARGPPI